MRPYQQKCAWCVSLIVAAIVVPGPVPAQPLCPAANKDGMQRHAFRFDNGSWSDVFERLSLLTDLPLMCTMRPTGGFKFIPPMSGGRDKLYTVEEIIDLVNDILAPQHVVVIRRQATLTVLAADEPIDPGLLSVKSIEDLPKLGRTECVRITYPLARVSAHDIAPIARRWAGPFGQVIPMEEVNRLVLVDAAGNLCRMVAGLRERSDPSKCALWSYRCRHARAEEVAAKLNERFGAPADARKARVTQLVIATDAPSNTLYLSGPAAILARARTMVENLEAAGRNLVGHLKTVGHGAIPKAAARRA